MLKCGEPTGLDNGPVINKKRKAKMSTEAIRRFHGDQTDHWGDERSNGGPMRLNSIAAAVGDGFLRFDFRGLDFMAIQF